jgi:hypothetical protein
LGNAGRIVMPPWTHNPRRRGIPLTARFESAASAI